MDVRLAVKGMQPRHLLVVDDEEGILQALRRMLRRDGYTIHLAGSGEEGLRILEHEPIGVIISDQRMPSMTGAEFLSKVKETYPDTIRMVLSGYTDLNTVTDAINRGAIYKFLTKPWDDDLLRRQIADAFDIYEMKQNNANLASLNDAMINAVPDALLLVDLKQKSVIATNPAAARLLGYATNELVGKPIADLEPLPLDQCYWEEINDFGFRPLAEVETEYQCADGGLVPVRKTTSLIKSGPGSSVLILVRDLRGERLIEATLERLNAELASVFEATSDGLLVLDADHKLSRMNRQLKRIWGIPDELMSAAAGNDILAWIAAQSATPEDTQAELSAHFLEPEVGDSGYFQRANGDTIRWFANPQLLNDDVVGHVFGFSVAAATEIWSDAPG